jgi:hypothetical protein
MPSLKDDISWTVSEFKLAQLLSVHNVKELNNHGKFLSLAEKKSEIMIILCNNSTIDFALLLYMKAIRNDRRRKKKLNVSQYPEH